MSCVRRVILCLTAASYARYTLVVVVVVVVATAVVAEAVAVAMVHQHQCMDDVHILCGGC